MTRHPSERRMSLQHGWCRRGQRESLVTLISTFALEIGFDGVDRDSSNRVICRAQKHRAVIEISSDDDDDVGEATPAAKAKGR